jgi:KUP system potassium uptake protein
MDQADQPSGDVAISRKYLLSLSLAALGIVYGDIGTSPLYAIRECFYGEHGVGVSEISVLGVLSLILWSLITVVSLKYLVYILRMDNRREGGILALMALGSSSQGLPSWTRRAVIWLGLFGAALLYGDGMITPAISVLSAVEGIKVAAPGLERWVVPITVAILVGLFSVQSSGTARVGAIFGPVTAVWFAVLALLGVMQVVREPSVLRALNPYWGARFLLEHGVSGYFVLGSVFLVVTGGEALYADMGHFGRRPIRLTWFAVVFPALLLNYFGQGALLLRDGEAAHNPFFEMAPGWATYPLVVLSTAATIIASQAMISGAFSLTRQATMLGFWPRTRIAHTSSREIGQIYVPSINWLLMFASIGLVLGFRSSSNLAAAYGIAVTSTMVITTLLAVVVAHYRWHWSVWTTGLVTLGLLVIDLAFLGANIVKVADGGWFPLGVGASMFMLMSTWKRGRQVLQKRILTKTVPLQGLFQRMSKAPPVRVPGTAVFLSSHPDGVPPALLHNLLHNHVLHSQIILMTILIEEVARVTDAQRVHVEQIEHGFVRVVARYGFTETPDVIELLARDDTPTPRLEETTFFLGRETLIAGGQYGMSRWRERLFGFMSRNAMLATKFFNVPADRVMEVGTHIEL